MSDPIANDERDAKSYFRICEQCGGKEYKVIVGNIIDYVHNSNPTVICPGKW